MRRVVACCAAVVVTSALATSPAAAHEKKSASAAKSGLAIEGYAAYDGQDTCRTTEQPGVAAFRDLVLARFPQTGDSGILRGCQVGRRSEHKEGRAWDWHVDAKDPADSERATQLINWLLAPDADGNPHARARRLGLMYIIWDRHIWRSYRNPELGMAHPYSGPNAHADHVHFSFSEVGAAGKTSFWKLANVAIGPGGTQTAIVVRYVDDTLKWFSADEQGQTAIKSVFGVRLGGNVPVAGDWNGDGVATEGLAWPQGRRLMWFLKPAKGAKPGVAFGFGARGDVPVVGDWDGDGRTTVGVVRKDRGRLLWLLSNDNRTVAKRFYYGRAGTSTPVAGDWDGDGRTSAGVVVSDGSDGLRWLLGANAVRRAAPVDLLKAAKAEAAKATAAKSAAAKAKAAKVRRGAAQGTAGPAAAKSAAVKEKPAKLGPIARARAARAARAAAAAKAKAAKAADAAAALRAAELARSARVSEETADERVAAAEKAERAAQAERAAASAADTSADEATASTVTSGKAGAETAGAETAGAEKAGAGKAGAAKAGAAKAGAAKAGAAKATTAKPARPVTRWLATALRVSFGERGARPVAGDWDGDGRTTFGTVEVQDDALHWHVTSDAGKTQWMFDHGLPGDRPVVGDLDGASAADLPEAKPVDEH